MLQIESKTMRSLKDLSLRNRFLLITTIFTSLGILLYGIISTTINYRMNLLDTEQTMAVASRSISDGIIALILDEQKRELKRAALELSRKPQGYFQDFLTNGVMPLYRYDSTALLDDNGTMLKGNGFMEKMSFDYKMMISQIRPDNVIDGFVNNDNNSFILQGSAFKNSGHSYYLFGALTNSGNNALYRVVNDIRVKNSGFSAIFADSEVSIQPLYASNHLPRDATLFQAVYNAPFNHMAPISAGPYQYYIYKARVAGSGIYSAFFISKAEVMSIVYRSIVIQMLVFIVLSFFVWLFVSSSVKKITRPLEDLTGTMTIIAQGSYDVSIKPSSRNDEIGVLSRTFVNLVHSVQDYSEKLKLLSVSDPLTDLFNKRELDNRLDIEWERSVRYGANLGFLMLDIDYFKSFNDDFGHEAGDEVLKSVANTISQSIRKSDTAFRYGGEEFCVMLPETSLEQAGIVAEKIRVIIEQLPPMSVSGKRLRAVTISIGAAAYPECVTSKAALIGSSDQALYKAKEYGRNRIALAQAMEAVPTH